MGNRNYESRETTLEELFDEVRDFSLVIPHFQRNFVWDEKEKQKSLLRSMLAGIPIGSILLLEDSKDSYASRSLCFPGFPPEIKEDRCKFLLDGQQRLSTLKSMFCDLFSKDEMDRLRRGDWKELWDDLPGQLRNRWFLKIDIDSEEEKDIFGFKNLTFEGDNENDPFSPSDFDTHIEYLKIKKSKPYDLYHPDCTDYEATNSYAQLINYAVSKKLLPLSLLHTKTMYTFREILERIAKNEHLNEEEKGSKSYEECKEKIKQWANAVGDFLTERTFKAKIHSIILKGKTGIAVGIHIFEQVNRGGVKLDVYDLLVARMAHNKKNLTKEIKKIIEKPQNIMQGMNDKERGEFNSQNMDIWDEDNDIPEKKFRNAFKNCLAVCVKHREGEGLSSDTAKEKTILSLTKDEIQNHWKETVRILLSVLQFLQFRCGIIKIKDIPYELLIVPLFVFFMKHNNKPNIEDINRIEFWYWASIFSGYYEKKQSTQIIKDSKDIMEKRGFEDRLEKILKAPGYSDKKSLTTEENSGTTPLSKAFPQYVLSTRPLDFLAGDKSDGLTARDFAEGKLKKHEHHIVPISKIENDEDEKGLRKKKLHPVNSPINQMYISEPANLDIKNIYNYKDNKKVLNCEKSISPNPIADKYIGEDKGKYDLEKFLSDRFDLLEEHIKKHLKSLI